MAGETPKEIYEALVWLRDHGSIENKWRLQKIESLAEWYEKTGTLSEKQLEFAINLIREE